ncbi:DHA2 family efflux MFS transporter permease subunit [Actinoallomurus vinaceus]|uniref:DHA2 family efflux MFS transporter permease subunit n=1 Tax=Actinoallomurus vinaceus TaxID=1080074 RepID=A0ABP8UI95_9ACTN
MYDTVESTEPGLAAPAASDRSRWLALVVLCGGMLLIVIDATVVNVALPAIQRDLGFSSSGLAWVVNAYLIAFGGLLLLAGRLGDLVSRRRVFITGLVVFTTASLACGLAQGPAMLIAARFVQGVGGAMTSSVILGMIVTLFPEPREQAKAIGVYSFVASAGGSAGLLAGGLLTQALNWHWIFFINLPVGVATLVLSLRVLDRDKGLGFGAGTDVLGAVLITAALMLGVYTIVDPAAARGWTAPRTLELASVTLVLLIAFVVREATARSPLVPLRIFRSRNVTGANVVQALAVSGMFGMFFLGVLYLQRVLGYDALRTGLAFLPTTVVMATVSLRFAERLITAFSVRATLLSGLTLAAVGLALFARAPVNGVYLVDVLPSVVLIGTGVGVAFPALAALAMSDATPSDAGLASGLINTTTQVGAAVGLAVLATLSAAHGRTLAGHGASAVAAAAGGYRLGFVVAAALVAIAVLIAVTVPHRMERRSSDSKDIFGIEERP